MTGVLVALGAGVGAPLRYLIASHLDRPGFPVGTLVVNLVGSFMLGIFSGLSLTGHELALLGTGFCGGFTTYSAFSVQTVEQGRRTGTIYAIATVAGGLLACTMGYLLTQA